MSLRRARQGRGHLLMEALAGGVLLSLTLAAIASGEVASRRRLYRGIEALEMERAATERLEYLRSQPLNSPVWTAPSSGSVPGHSDWVWTLAPVHVEDGNVRGALTSFSYLRATVTITAPDGRTVVRETLRW
ncbi:hypothetical protein [Hyalangium rubrum]|uniref:Type II secretion system protein n=1 Tax=Hyalangium rubrum TaxID=3103134 RepID=A0ABU5H2S8_9BACT|nr:hypothetical protein [Hyalangium sp. s54d21]MDY7227407.1 hypothetical protein [Hyalangium sp. s54d21]